MNIKKDKTRVLVAVALFAALVFIFTYIHIDIPTPLGKTMIHLGNVMCLLAGMLLGGLNGGLAAGFGSMFFDLFDPVFLPECWVTFILKFAMAFAAGAIAHGEIMKKLRGWRFVVAAAAGAVLYTALYLAKTFIINYWIFGYELETVMITLATKGTVSAVNGVIAAAAAIALNAALRPALRRAGIFDSLGLRD